VIHLHRKEYEKAVADFTEAIRLRPTYDQPYKNRAAAKKALGDTAGANEDLNQAKALKQ
jgi:Flp pilus assembly protein TadD